jgi:hypothetical protein
MSILVAVVGIGILIILVTAVMAAMASMKRKSATVVGEGEGAAAARVLEIIDTGNRYNYNPVVRLRLEVQPGDALPYDAEVETVVSVVDLPAFQPGAVIRVKYRKEKPSDVAVLGR